MHSTLFLERRAGSGLEAEEAAEEEQEPPQGRGQRLSRLQSRSWADRRVHEGVARAKAGDQKGALERYGAALELCPGHKEGLVGRGAALVKVGRVREALLDFDRALRLDPEDVNARKYREIARRRLAEEAVSTGAGLRALGLASFAASPSDAAAAGDRKRHRPSAR